MLTTERVESLTGSQPDLEPGWLYHDAAWSRVLQDGFSVSASHLVTRDRDNAILAVTPVWCRRRFGLLLSGSPLRGLHTEFCGPRFARGMSEHLRAEVVLQQHELLRTWGSVYVEWGGRGSLDPTPPAEYQPLTQAGCQYVRGSSLTVNLRGGLESVWKGFEGRARTAIRKAQKMSVEVGVEPMEGEGLQSFLAMLTETFQRQDMVSPHPVSAYEAMWRHLGPAGFLRFVVARIEGIIVSAGVFLRWDDRMLFLSGASTAEGLRSAASSLVQWEAVQDGVATGVREYDMGGVGLASVDKFKTSFGGEASYHHRWVYRAWPVRALARPVQWLMRRGTFRLFG